MKALTSCDKEFSIYDTGVYYLSLNRKILNETLSKVNGLKGVRILVNTVVQSLSGPIDQIFRGKTRRGSVNINHRVLNLSH